LIGKTLGLLLGIQVVIGTSFGGIAEESPGTGKQNRPACEGGPHQKPGVASFSRK